MSAVVQKKIDVHVATSDTSKTYVCREEDHTVGNSVRYLLMRSPEVDFCGYTIPHPSEPNMHLRIQTNGSPADAVLRKGVQDLKEVSEHVNSVYLDALKEFKNM